MKITLWEEVRIDSEITPEMLEELSVSSIQNRLDKLSEKLPKFAKLEPNATDVINKIKEVDLQQAFDTQIQNLYRIHSILINFDVYLDLILHKSLTDGWQKNYENDVEKLKALLARIM
ncbi:hypothetical protein [Photobacterium atrarenae]|uniref:Uncharacterized protein n=1 Tax=Photobacterium atrarenae TaxID=865757 RepID=A0ABY5GMM5_9GAMM|nr:hypothetical protein [Photobacterium atrarenae]UTV30183.1 hypothetical protein NNL38_16485 [Photobacterium atrarenae]